MLRDRFVCGINNSAIQKCLLAEPDLMLKKAVSIAQAAEIADTGVKELQSSTACATNEKTVHTAPTNPTDNSAKPKECYRCGTKHNPDQCRFKS